MMLSWKKCSIIITCFSCLLSASLVVNPTEAFVIAPSTGLTVHHHHRSNVVLLHESKKSDSFDMDELKHRIAAEKSNPFADLFASAAATDDNNNIPVINKSKEEFVHYISFAGKGIHSIEYPKGSGNNVVLAFESAKSCQKFADTLRAQHFFDPTPQKTSLDAIDKFCERLGVYVQLVPKGVELIPPSQNVEEFGISNNHLREQQNRLNYIFAMVDGADFDDEGLILEQVLNGAFA